MKTRLTIPPNHQPRDWVQRSLEVGWGLTPFILLAAIVTFSFFHLTLAAILLLAYTLGWFVRLVGYAYRLVGSYYRYRSASAIDWRKKMATIKKAPYQAVIVAMYNEPENMLRATIEAVLASDYDQKKLLLIVAYEERGGAATDKVVQRLVREYAKGPKLITAVKHPYYSVSEPATKAANITYAARWLSNYCKQQRLPAKDVIVTTLDTDNRPHPQYLAALAWTYATVAEPTRCSYQPIPLFTNNIWDAPAISRVMAADTTFWFMMDGARPRRLRLFSAHAQSLQTLEDVEYWNISSVVEDGHQYWRTYFTYNGDHHVVPIWLPIYQDAVIGTSVRSTLSTQFRQLQRWAWGAADTPFIIREAARRKDIGWWNKTVHVTRQMDDYLSWATTPLILAIGAWLPWLVEAARPGGHTHLAFQLFHVIVGLQVLALGDLVIAVIVYMALLPPRPARYTRIRTLMMVLQWVLEPLTLLGYVSITSLIAHARLVLNRPLEEFHVTPKTDA